MFYCRHQWHPIPRLCDIPTARTNTWGVLPIYQVKFGYMGVEIIYDHTVCNIVLKFVMQSNIHARKENVIASCYCVLICLYWLNLDHDSYHCY